MKKSIKVKSIIISNNPFIKFINEPSNNFKNKNGFTIKIKNNINDVIVINSGWCHNGWWDIFEEQLNLLKMNKIKKISYGGSEGNFSKQFTLSKKYFTIRIHNFGEELTILKKLKITL